LKAAGQAALRAQFLHGGHNASLPRANKLTH